MRRLGVAVLVGLLNGALLAQAIDPSNPLARFFTSETLKGPAAALNAMVPEGSSLFVYVPRLGSAIPVNDGVIPADTVVIPMIVRGGAIVSIGMQILVPAGERATADFTPPRAGRSHVIVPVVLAPESDSSIPPPEIVLRGAKESLVRPIDPLKKGQTAALLFFHDAPASATLAISGPRWKTIAQPVAAKSDVALLDTVTAIQTTKLMVNWWAPIDPATLVKKDEAPCKQASGAFNLDRQRPSTEQRFVAVLYACAAQPNHAHAIDPRTCQETARHAITGSGLRGTVEFEGTPAGLYRVDLEYPHLPVIGKVLDLSPKESTTVDLELRYITFFGKITRGKKPLHASIFGTTSDPDTGDYIAAVTRLPNGTQELLPCDGSPIYRFVSDDPPKEGSAFDIDVPDNKIVVEVHDADSGAAIPKAKILFGAVLPGDRENAMHFAGTAATTDDDGSATIAPVLKNRKIKLCASRDDYETKCEPDFMMDVEEKTVRLDLQKVQVQHARVDAQGPFTRGMLVWVSPQSGSITEMVREFQDDGSFTYKRQHPPGEVVVFSAADKPLYAFLQAPIADDPFVISLPIASVRSFDVSLSDSSKEASAWVTLSIGGVPVPLSALNWHLGTRLHVVAPLRPGATLHVADILTTGAIEVILIPMNAYQSNRELPFVPEAPAFPRKELGTNNAIIFP